jgi:plasmid stability protein
MSTISIHDLDEELERKLRRLARENGRSLNKTIKDILAARLGSASRRNRNGGRFARFCGRWSKKQAREFAAATREFGRIDRSDWE